MTQEKTGQRHWLSMAQIAFSLLLGALACVYFIDLLYEEKDRRAIAARIEEADVLTVRDFILQIELAARAQASRLHQEYERLPQDHSLENNLFERHCIQPCETACLDDQSEEGVRFRTVLGDKCKRKTYLYIPSSIGRILSARGRSSEGHELDNRRLLEIAEDIEVGARAEDAIIHSFHSLNRIGDHEGEAPPGARIVTTTFFIDSAGLNLLFNDTPQAYDVRIENDRSGDLRFQERPFYIECLESLESHLEKGGAPENFVYTSAPYDDQVGDKYIFTIAVPVTDREGKVRGITGADVLLYSSSSGGIAFLDYLRGAGLVDLGTVDTPTTETSPSKIEGAAHFLVELMFGSSEPQYHFLVFRPQAPGPDTGSAHIQVVPDQRAHRAMLGLPVVEQGEAYKRLKNDLDPDKPGLSGEIRGGVQRLAAELEQFEQEKANLRTFIVDLWKGDRSFEVRLSRLGRNLVIGRVEPQADLVTPIAVLLLTVALLLSAVLATVATAKRLGRKNQQLRLALERLRRRATHIMELVSFVAHEVRAPMATFRAIAENLHDSIVHAKPIQVRSVQAIELEAKRMMEVLATLLDLTQIDAALDEGRLMLKPRKLDLRDLLSQSVDITEPQITHKGLNLETRFSDVPPVLGDPHLLSTVVSILINNAISHANKGTILVGCTAKQDSGMVTLWIQDEGPGIPEDEKEAIFEVRSRGRQVHRTNRAGWGLGLALAKRVVHAHGGTIDVESRPGEGACFRIGLPIADASAPEDTETSEFLLRAWDDGQVPAGLLSDDAGNNDEAPEDISRRLQGAGELILWAEDDPHLREALGSTLTRHGYQVIEASSGAEAGEILNQRPDVDLVLTDLRVPTIDQGYALIQRAKSRQDKDIPVIVLTSADAREPRLNCFEKGADEYHIKGHHGVALLQRIRNLLDREIRSRELARKDTIQSLHQEVFHDVRNELQKIDSFLKVDAAELPDPKKAYISGELRDIAEMLGLARIEAALARTPWTPDLVPVDLCHVLREIVAGWRTTPLFRGIRIHSDIPVKCFVRSNRVLLKRSVENLLKNAAEAQSSSAGDHIQLRAVLSDETVELTIADTGRGMPAEVVQMLRRGIAPAISNKGPGHGIGLHSVLDSLRVIGSTLDVESKPGQGTAVTIKLPRSADPSETTDSIEGRLAQEGRRHSVLVVEDDVLHQEAWRSLLSTDPRIGEIIVAESIETLKDENFRFEHVDLAITDCEYQGRKSHGYDVVAYLSNRTFRAIPVIACTAHAGDEELRAQMRDLGVKTIIGKPIPEDVLQRHIIPALSGASQHEAGSDRDKETQSKEESPCR